MEERKCPDIPREELEKLCTEGYTDKKIAELYNTTAQCILKLRQKYGMNKRALIKERNFYSNSLFQSENTVFS